MTELPDAEIQRLRRRLARIARLMDNSIRVPVIGKRIGWDALVGLIPGVGDLAGALVSAYIVFVAWRLGVPAKGLVRMLGNVGIETLVGAVPLFGDVFDMAFKANVRNVAVVEQHLGGDEPASGARQASGGRADSGTAVTFLLLGAGMAPVADTLAMRLLAFLS